MTALIDLQSQIENLKKQAEAIRSKEFASTVAEICATMQAFGITIKDLQTAPKKGTKKVKAAGAVKLAKAPKSSRAGVKVEAKYKGPNGEAWTGRGLTPKWLATLVTEGRKKEEFLVATTVASTTVQAESIQATESHPA